MIIFMNPIKRFLCVIAGLSLLLQATAAQACRIIPVEKNPAQYITNIIKNTPDIYLAVATAYSETDESFTLQVKEVIRGEKRTELIVMGQPVSQLADPKTRQQYRSDFLAHKESSFWSNPTKARTALGDDCRLQPAFEIGEQYLVLYKTPFQPKSFELVKTKQDRWFQHVFETLYPPKKKKRVVPTAKTETSAVDTPALPQETSPPSEP